MYPCICRITLPKNDYTVKGEAEFLERIEIEEMVKEFDALYQSQLRALAREIDLNQLEITQLEIKADSGSSLDPNASQTGLHSSLSSKWNNINHNENETKQSDEQQPLTKCGTNIDKCLECQRIKFVQSLFNQTFVVLISFFA